MIIKKAFTMIEFVFVIVIIGIIASTVIPSFKSNTIHEEVIKFIADVRYTQHLGMINDTFDSTNPDWQKQSYCMNIDLLANSWSINKITPAGVKEFALEPLNLEPLFMSLNETDFEITSTKQITRLCFDHLGRPLSDNLEYTNANLIKENIIFKFSNSTDMVQVIITPETGYIRRD